VWEYITVETEIKNKNMVKRKWSSPHKNSSILFSS